MALPLTLYWFYDSEYSFSEPFERMYNFHSHESSISKIFSAFSNRDENHKVLQILNRAAQNGVTDPIVRARINILFYMMSLTIFFSLILTINYIINGPSPQLIRVLILVG